MRISIIEDWRVNPDKSGYLNQVDSIFEGDFVDCIEQRLTHHTTHGIFRDNIRTNDNFISSDMVVIDFDKGLITPEEVAENVGLYNFAITASSNHNCDKCDGRGVISRFHLCIELAQTINGVENYKDLVKYCIEKLQFSGFADDSSANATRYWKRQKELLLYGENRKPLDTTQIIQFLEKKRYLDEQLAIQKRPIDNTFKAELFIKTHKELISNLSTNGMRSTSLCSLIGKIKKLGFGENEVREVIFGNCNLPQKEIDKTLKSFFK